MKSLKKTSAKKILNYLTDYLLLNLNELKALNSLSAFNEGELLAYIECIEAISAWSGFTKQGVTDIEKEFNIN